MVNFPTHNKHFPACTQSNGSTNKKQSKDLRRSSIAMATRQLIYDKASISLANQIDWSRGWFPE